MTKEDKLLFGFMEKTLGKDFDEYGNIVWFILDKRHIFSPPGATVINVQDNEYCIVNGALVSAKSKLALENPKEGYASRHYYISGGDKENNSNKLWYVEAQAQTIGIFSDERMCSLGAERIEYEITEMDGKIIKCKCTNAGYMNSTSDIRDFDFSKK